MLQCTDRDGVMLPYVPSMGETKNYKKDGYRQQNVRQR